MPGALHATIVATLLILPSAAVAAGEPSSHLLRRAPAGGHATTGTVKSLDATTLVIVRHGRASGDMSFTMTDDTHGAAAVRVGDTVSIRYRDEGPTHVATAITVQHASKSGSRVTTN